MDRPFARDHVVALTAYIAQPIAQPAAHNTLGLQTADKLIQFLRLGSVDRKRTIEPNLCNRAILDQQFVKLRFHLLFEVTLKSFAL